MWNFFHLFDLFVFTNNFHRPSIYFSTLLFLLLFFRFVGDKIAFFNFYYYCCYLFSLLFNTLMRTLTNAFGIYWQSIDLALVFTSSQICSLQVDQSFGRRKKTITISNTKENTRFCSQYLFASILFH